MECLASDVKPLVLTHFADSFYQATHAALSLTNTLKVIILQRHFEKKNQRKSLRLKYTYHKIPFESLTTLYWDKLGHESSVLNIIHV